MKILILLILTISCTQKYAGYDLIRKIDFNKESFERPTSVYQVLPEGKDELKSCFNQFLFFSNAEKEKNSAEIIRNFFFVFHSNKVLFPE